MPGSTPPPGPGHGWDDLLASPHKGLRTRPGKLLLGSTGARLWADYLDPEPGFVGRLDFIHKTNIPLLYRVAADLQPDLTPWRAMWRPSHLHLRHEGAAFGIDEYKFITWDDCAVSGLTWTNRTGRPARLRLEVDPAAFPPPPAGEGDPWIGQFPLPRHAYAVEAAIACSDPRLPTGLTLAPGQTRTLVVAAALGVAGEGAPARLHERARRYAVASGREDLLHSQRREYAAWFEGAPRFLASDALLERTWAYRWFVLRHNLADPRCGALRHPFFCEGRSHKKGKAPFSTGGWEFSKFIPLSAPLHLLDARWHADQSPARGVLRTAADSQDADGLFCALTVAGRLHSFANFLPWAAYQWYLVHRDDALAREVLPALRRSLDGCSAVHGNPRNRLLVERRHSRTGKEYQPSFWYFHGFPQDPKDPATYTPLQRVDSSVYHYLNISSVARFGALLGDAAAAELAAWAAEVRHDIVTRMWDPASRFFYDLHHETDAPALVKNIVGVYPAWAEMVDGRHDGLVAHLLDPREFATGCPFPSVSADCAAYAPAGGWFGRFLKGRNGCMWNGPTWPYTNAIALDALGKESRRLGHRYDADFARCLRAYSWLHFEGRDLQRPALVEHYCSSTGEPLSDEQEYNHSYYVDLIVRHVAGLHVGEDRLAFDPLDAGLDWFTLEGLRVAGAEVAVTYRRPGAAAAPAGLAAGYRVYIGGRLAHRSDGLGPATLPLPEGGHSR